MNSPTAIVGPFHYAGRKALAIVNELGALSIFTFCSFFRCFRWPWPYSKVIYQVYFIGVASLPVVLLVAFFAGMVLGLQGYYTLRTFGSEGLLGGAIALSLVRELGPVLTAIMVVGQAGSAMAAEIADMRNSEQIDALRSMSIDPLRFLVGPRLIAALISFPLLTAIFDYVGLLGGYFTSVTMLQLDAGIYWHRAASSVETSDIAMVFYKAFVFALVTTALCCYQGYFIHRRQHGKGSQGIRHATTTAVVASSAAILISDYLITSILV